MFADSCSDFLKALLYTGHTNSTHPPVLTSVCFNAGEMEILIFFVPCSLYTGESMTGITLLSPDRLVNAGSRQKISCKVNSEQCCHFSSSLNKINNTLENNNTTSK